MTVRKTKVGTRRPRKVSKPNGKYHEGLCDEAIKLFGKGLSKEAVAGAFGVTRQTLYSWINHYPEFGEAVEQGEAKASQFFEKEGIKQVQRGNASAWMFFMKNRFNWRDKQEYTGENGGPLKIELVSYKDVDDSPTT